MHLLHRNSDATPKRSHKARILAGVVLATSAGAAGFLGVGLSAAQASPLAFHPIISNSSWLDVAVRGGSSSAGTDLIQWGSDNGSEQQWAVNGNEIVNENSGMCITTDGIAGDSLKQEPCVNSPYQQWDASYVWWAGGSTLYNPASGLVMDVAGNSYGWGAEIDAWYPNNGLNQVFSMPGQPGF